MFIYSVVVYIVLFFTFCVLGLEHTCLWIIFMVSSSFVLLLSISPCLRSTVHRLLCWFVFVFVLRGCIDDRRELWRNGGWLLEGGGWGTCMHYYFVVSIPSPLYPLYPPFALTRPFISPSHFSLSLLPVLAPKITKNANNKQQTNNELQTAHETLDELWQSLQLTLRPPNACYSVVPLSPFHFLSATFFCSCILHVLCGWNEEWQCMSLYSDSRRFFSFVHLPSFFSPRSKGRTNKRRENRDIVCVLWGPWLISRIYGTARREDVNKLTKTTSNQNQSAQ